MRLNEAVIRPKIIFPLNEVTLLRKYSERRRGETEKESKICALLSPALIKEPRYEAKYILKSLKSSS